MIMLSRSASRWLSILLCVVVLSSLVPAYPAFAAEEDTVEKEAASVQGFEISEATEAGRPVLQAKKTIHAPIIDGKLDDSNWSIAEPLPELFGEAPFPASAFGMLWDNQYLYIGIRTEDHTPLQDQAGYWFEQDGMHLFFDPTMHRSTPFQPEDMQAGFLFRADSATPEFHFGAALNNHEGKDDKGIMRAMNQTATGWELEVAISWDMLQFDPQLSKQLGFNLGVTDRYGEDSSMQRTAYWSAYDSSSFWNDTSGYGTIQLQEDMPVIGPINPVLLEESFDGVLEGALPYGWISDVNAGSPSFTVTQSTYGGRMSFDGSSAGKQGRVTAPVQWDDYTIEADVRFEAVHNSGRWTALMFRGIPEGTNPYNQMAVRQNGTYEVAYRKPDNGWSVMASGVWQPLALNEDYQMKVRVYGDNVKEYLKAKDDPQYTLVLDQSFPSGLLQRGKVGFQADQSKVSFDNLKVTRLAAERLDLIMPSELEALTGPVTVTGSVYYSDGLTEAIPLSGLKLYSSDESVMKVIDGNLYPLKAGQVTVKAIYGRAEATYEMTVKPSSTGAKVVELRHEQGYVLATAGTPLSLDSLTFLTELSDFTSGTLQGGALAWHAEDSKVVIEDGSMHIEEQGVYRLTAEIDGVSAELLVVAKDAADSVYTLYEQDFDSIADGDMPDGWSRIEGSTASKAAVQGGAFQIDASSGSDNPSRVLLPEYLGMFGDYRIEADVTHLSANDNGRWHSIMYRVQNGNYPYYQMAVRKDASAANGVEFAERTPANGWAVHDKGPFSGMIESDQMYRYTVIARGNRVQEWINDELIIDTDAAGGYLQGLIGLQANGSKMKVDNIRITLQQEELPPMPADRFANVYEPDTKIVMGPTIATELTREEQLASLSEPPAPATVIIHVNDVLDVLSSGDGSVIGELPSVLQAMEGHIIPAFYVTGSEAASEVAKYAKGHGIEDAFIVSSQGELIQQAREIAPMLRGILDFSGQQAASDEELLDIRRETTISGSKIAILSEAAATEENVEYLQQRAVVVWTKAEADQAGRSVALHHIIATGTNGIVTDSPDKAIAALGVYNHETTLVRKPYIIGHRGMPSKSPENTIESNLLAYENGADFIENDMYVTKDDHLVIVHDGVLQNTTNGSGPVEDFTLEEIKQLNANKPYPEGYPDVKVPTLDEQIELAREKGIMVYAEIKTGTPRAVDVLVNLIKEKDAEELINVMAFHTSQLKLFAEQMPGMPVGLLVGSGPDTDANVNKALRDTLRTTQTLNATYNAGYYGMGQAYLEAAKHRGIIVSPWTINNLADYKTFFMRGIYGITTDYAYYSADWNISLEPEQEQYTLEKGESVTLTARAETYDRTVHEVVPDIIWLQGEELLDTDGAALTAKSAGTAYAMLRYTSYLDDANAYDLYTKPIAIEVTGSSDGDGDGNGDGDGDGDGDGNGDGDGDGDSDTGTGTGTDGADPCSDSSREAGSHVVVADGQLACSAHIQEAFNSSSSVTVQFEGDSLSVKADAWPEEARSENGMFIARNEVAAYRFPAAAWQPELWANLLGSTGNGDDLTLRFTMKKLEGQEAQNVKDAVKASGGNLVHAAIQFEVEVVDSEGNTAAVPFGTSYVVREIGLDGKYNASQLTALQYMEDTQQLQFVPAQFRYENGKTIALVKRNGNSVYVLAAYDKSFDDIQGHWAKREIELLANKGLIHGMNENSFAPDRSVTRAEFASMLVRALGLIPAEAGASFADVSASAWYASDVSAAVNAGLILGYADGSFRPEASINREEQIAMIVRALQYAGTDISVTSDAEQQRILDAFQDQSDIVWAQKEVAAAVAAGLIKGAGSDMLQAQKDTTRAESVMMLKRFLDKAEFL
ncbi:glycerophosphodiester phosphodiesterase family protein [Paenibacillus sp. J5C_2022]|uniref:glycerophosphodiester phosphodiesterase family protein n=1 Tax=Paenibacillus sp. J5C2022 TaxID=2977129 RepID=UPI0021D207CF|nr:glycerophosphodiester phosphodiesterase family protein [Paenibacillus sp. J5C2022]MCU6707922.1 glycerophosphodiester phosphodiesterase family protein [Paenibacillus sp. J5C2022]